MTADPQIPSSDDVMAPGLTELARLRPAALKFFNYGKGVWANVVAGLKAQVDLELARLAGAAKNGRLSLSEGDELLALVRSEFDALHELGPTKALGAVTIDRTALAISLGSSTGIGVTPIVITSSEPHQFTTGQYVIVYNVLGNTAANGTWPVVVLSPTTFSLPVSVVANGTGFLGLAIQQLIPGVIPKGTRFRRNARLVAPLISEAIFEVPSDVSVPVDQAIVSVPLVAITEGAVANTPLSDAGELVTSELIDSLFDPLLSTTIAFESAGGSDGASDDDIRQYAKAYYLGQYAPTDGALLAGSFNSGARHVKISDMGTGTTTISIADSSWASSANWAAQTKQTLYNEEWIGFGGSVSVGTVVNKLISVTASIVVADQTVLSDTTELVQSARLALTEYLDSRPDWYNWNLAAMRGVLSRLDRKKVLDCLSIEVRDGVGTLLLVPDVAVKHYMLTELHVTFLSPT